MAVTQEVDVPPCAFLADILGAIVGDIVPVVYPFDSVTPVVLEPTSPNHVPRFAFAVAPQHVRVVSIPTGVLFEPIELRDAEHFGSHNLLVTPLS